MYLHSEGFVHSDLKGACPFLFHFLPLCLHIMQQDNVLIDNENRACLADFSFMGVCIPFGTTGASNSSNIGGTKSYMAPELLVHQARKDLSSIPPPKKPANIYALSMVIYKVFSHALYFTMEQAQDSGRCSLGNSPFPIQIPT